MDGIQVPRAPRHHGYSRRTSQLNRMIWEALYEYELKLMNERISKKDSVTQHKILATEGQFLLDALATTVRGLSSHSRSRSALISALFVMAAVIRADLATAT